MAIIYLNTKINGKLETIDQMDKDDYADNKAFRAAKNHLIVDYQLAGGFGSPYWSSRCTKDWK